MTQARSDRRRVPSRPTRDPGYRPTRPAPAESATAPNGFWPAPVSVCGRCSAMIPATDKARQLHRSFHDAIDGLEQRGPR